MPPRIHPAAAFHSHRFGLVQPRGDVCADSAIRATSALVALPGWEPGFSEVWDFRFAGTFTVHPSSIPGLRQQEVTLREELAGSETLLITGGRPLIAYAARFYDRLLRPFGRSARACTCPSEACALLGVDRIPDLLRRTHPTPPQVREPSPRRVAGPRRPPGPPGLRGR